MSEIVSFGEWVQKRRNQLRYTRKGFADLVGCAPITIKKIERDERKPSAEIGELLATHLQIPEADKGDFMRWARGEFLAHFDSPKEMPFSETQSLAAPAEAPKHNLPSQTTMFVGRTSELAQIVVQLANPACRMLTILGFGGMGKTRLAIETAKGQIENFTDGVYLISLAPLRAVEHIIPAMADALDFHLESNSRKRPPQQQILDYLRQKQLLLVMDNFEHLLAGIDIVSAILQVAPNVQILATSRERLNLQEEQLFNLHGLTFPDNETTVNSSPTDQENSYHAIKLFSQSARRHQHDFELTATDLSHLTHICQLVEGMPLAIELAASWVDTLSLSDIAVELQQNLDLLSSNLHNSPPRHRSIRAAFETSWQLLSQSERTILAKCSVFRGGFTRPAVQAICRASLRELNQLTKKTLLQYDRARDRFHFHELLRQYSVEQLAHDPKQETAVRQRQSTYFLQQLAQYEARLKSEQQFTALAELEADLENYRLSLSWAVQQEQTLPIANALPTLCLFYELTVRYQEGEDFCQTILNLISASKPSTLQVNALTWQAKFHYLQGQSTLAKQQLEKGVTLLESPLFAKEDMRAEQAAILLGLGQLGSLALNHHDQIQHYEQSLALYESLNDGWGMNKVLTAMCWVVRHQVVVDTAVQWQQQLAQGEQLARRSVTICRQIGDQAGEAHALVQVASFALYRGRDSEALATIDDCIALCASLGFKGVLADATVYRGMICASDGQYDQARAAIQSAYEIAQTLGYYHQLSNCLRVLGVIALAEGRFVEAWRWSSSSVATYRAAGDHHYLCIALTVLGSAEYQLGNAEAARQHLVESLQLATRIRSYLLLWPVLSVTAVLLLQRGQLIRAIEICHLNLHFMGGALPRFNEDTFTKFVVAATADLPPEEVAAAQKRGQNLDLWATAEALLAEFKTNGQSTSA